jgi:ADP-ribose pyrophosphatase
VPGFRRLGERSIYQGHVISLGVGEFEAPDGHRFERDVVHHPGAVSVVPLLDNGDAVLVRQYRAALDRELLEIPAGKRDVEGEDPVVTAQRELGEEVGLRAAHLDLLAEFYNSPGFSDEHSYTYLATGLTSVAAAPDGAEEREMQIEHIALSSVPDLIASGDLVDAKSIIALLLTRERLKQE